MLTTLTQRQKEIYDFISMYEKVNNIAPSLEEIREHFNLKAVSTVHEHVEKLKNKGYLKKEMNQARGIKTTQPHEINNKLTEINLLGNIAAGEPIEAVENAEPIVICNDMVPIQGSCFALKVKGDSMIEDGIFDDDIVIVKSQSFAENGDTVVAIVNKDEATLKRFYKERDRVRLQPANKTLKPKFYKKIEIRGKVISLIRNYS